MNERVRLQAVEFAYWVGIVTALVVVVSLALGLAATGTLVAVKGVVFVVGAVMTGLGALALQPKRPMKDEKRIDFDGGDESELESFIQRLPGLSGRRLPFDDRVGRSMKVFATGLTLLVVSLVMETMFGIAVGPS